MATSEISSDSKVRGRKWNKVFEIGDAKTGTTSLHVAFRELGLKAQQWHPELYAMAEIGNFDPIFNHAEDFDAFTDGPWHDFDLYKEFDFRFPGSKFVLLQRDDSSWLRSYENHFSIKKNVNDIPKIYFIEHFESAKKEILAQHKIKYRQVRDYFKNRPDDLLVMNICAGEGWEKLCRLQKTVLQK